MAQDGRKILKLTGAFLAIIGVVTLVIGIVAYSNAGKTSETLTEMQKLTASSSKSTTATSTASTIAPIKEWISSAKTYALIMIAVSALHIVFGLIGFIMADKSENAMLLVGFGGILLVLGAVIVLYGMLKNKSDYDAAQSFMDLILPSLSSMTGKDFTFKLISLNPVKHVISYSSVLLGGMYLYGAMMSRGITPGSKPSTGRNVIPGTGPVDPDAFFEQFNKPPVPPKAPAPQGQPRPQGAPPQGQPRPQGAAPQGQPRPQGAPPQGQPRPQGAPPQGQPRPQGAPPQGQPRPQGAPPAGQPRPQGAPPQGQPRPQGAPPAGQPRPQGAPPQGQPRPQGAPPAGQPRPQGAPPQGQPRPQGTAPVGQPRPQVRPAPNLRPAPGVKPPKPADDEGPSSSGSMDEVILPSAEDLERILSGMSGQK